jgi:adenosylcobinamide kinase / adenosylcobinamide-phosphate guanylyltransferase
MSRVTLITGPVAAGKSRHACARAADCGSDVLFIATCEPRDEEMLAKVDRHRRERPPGWRTIERASNLASALAPGFHAAIVDCLTLFVSQKLLAGAPPEEIDRELDALLDAPPCPLFVVTNEVGWGVVPAHPLGRRFRDLLGRVNQRVARRADEVVLLVAGLPLFLKGAP